MSATNSAVPFTYEDYRNLPESLEQHELLDGDLYVSPAPTPSHQTIVQNIGYLLLGHVRETGAGRVFFSPVDVVLDEGGRRHVVQPDVLFISRAREKIVAENEIIGAPDLVIEVLSPGTAERDRGLKRTIYARAGVREHWIVDPALERVEACVLGVSGYGAPAVHERGAEVRPAVLPELRLRLTEVFNLG